MLSSPYRRDIDGLRAIAVLSVVGFHAFPDWIHGGFIGVDIFFVISGYLISYQIFTGLLNNNFSVLNFYERRIRRIFPALITVLFASLIMGWFFLLPDEFSALARNVLAGATFTSNFLLWSEAGYFDVAAISKPLLHLWSLGIEEQFYILWPLALLAINSKSLSIQKTLIWVIVFSFLSNIFLLFFNPIADFYSPISRFWELLFGAAIAWMHIQRSSSKWPSAKISNWLSVVASTFLVFGLFAINRDSLFPGFWALIPVIAAVLYIISGPNAFINRRVLSCQFLVGIGLISYPLYLWHWILLSFMQLIEENAWAVFELRLGVLLLSAILASITYFVIEKPLRHGAHLRLKVYLLILGMGAMILLALSVILSQGFPMRSMGKLNIQHSGDIGYVEFDRYLEDNFYPCLPDSIRQGSSDAGNQSKRCFQSKQGEAPQIAIIGDSHAEALFIGIAEAVTEKNVVYYNRDALPLLGAPEYESSFNYVLNSPNIDTVILAAYWTMRLKQNRLPFEVALANTIEKLQGSGKRVILFDDVPAFLFSPKRCKYSGMVGGSICSQSRTVHDVKKLLYAGTFNNLKNKYPDTIRIDPSIYFCGADSCSMEANGKLLYRDTHHLNIFGSQNLGLSLFDAKGNLLPAK